ncbi:ABC transporter ATP-binding protein [Larsenimonas salina]|uniref:ABC transporter ATP-binding protein n=1 Tax=Larsenimonas salina TaxID=1295565 RepID=UPI0020731C8F|nr:ABC transporter ATP-binding protein [Larsenimonas salina]MCM5703366.1 ABC transporter ATP-binding protein [Larsenimonas salina]
MNIEGRELSWTRQHQRIVDGVTLAVGPGETLGLIGPNGSGKSSLLHLMAGLRRPSGGRVYLDHEPIDGLSRRQVAQKVALVAQHSTTDADLRVEEVVRLGRIPHRGPLQGWTRSDVEHVEQALVQAGLVVLRHRRWHTLSGGERQRTQLARAMAQQPGVLLLDEPTNHLDIQHQLDLLTRVRALATSNIIALHDLNLAAMFCDRLVVLSEGQLVAQGAPEDVLTPALIWRIYGVDAAVERSPHHGKAQVHYLV